MLIVNFCLLSLLFLRISYSKHICARDKIAKKIKTKIITPNPTTRRALLEEKQFLMDIEVKIPQFDIFLISNIKIFFETRLMLKAPIPVNNLGLQPCIVKNQIFNIKKDHDLKVYIDTATQYCEDDTLAYEITCDRLDDGRPLNTYIGICEAFFNYDRNTQYKILLHEFFHAVGFDKESFEYYPKYKFAGYLQKGCLSSTNYRGYKIDTFIGPEAVDYVRDFFKCPSLYHVELDGSHLSPRLFHDQLMTPNLDTRVGVEKVSDSKLVFKMLEDSKWYGLSNYFYSANGKFGYHKGCNFVKMNCKDYFLEYRDEDFFCFSSAQKCAVFQYSSNIPKGFRYFKNHDRWGGYKNMEYCPIRKNYWNLNQSYTINRFQNSQIKIKFINIYLLILCILIFI